MPAASGYPVQFDGTNGAVSLTTIDGLRYLGGYCSLQDVLDLFLNNDSYTKITLNNNKLIYVAIADATGDLDRALEPRYVTPVTGTNSLEHLRFIVKHWAAAKLNDLLLTNAGGTETHLAASLHHQETGAQRLDDIMLGVTQLFDAVSQVNGERPLFPAGAAAGWNPDVDPNLSPSTISELSGPLFGVRQNPQQTDPDWIP